MDTDPKGHYTVFGRHCDRQMKRGDLKCGPVEISNNIASNDTSTLSIQRFNLVSLQTPRRLETI